MTRRTTIFAIFILYAAMMGASFARLPEVQARLMLSEGVFGLVLLAMPAGILVGSVLIPPYMYRWGTLRVIRLSFVTGCLGSTLAMVAPSALALASALFVTILAMNILNIAVNLEADRAEAVADRPLMNRAHGFWALSFLIMSVLSVGIIAAGIAPVIHLAVAGALCATGMLALLVHYGAAPRRSTSRTKARRFARPTWPVILIMGFAISGIAMEWGTRNWGIIFARDIFDAPDAVAAVMLPCLLAAQTFARFRADAWIARWGERRVVTTMLILTAAGLFAVAVGPTMAFALAGFAMIGVGMSITQPMSFSLAAQAPGDPSENLAGLALLQTVVVFVIPIGFATIAELFGLRVAFASFLIFPAASALFTRHLYPKAQPA